MDYKSIPAHTDVVANNVYAFFHFPLHLNKFVGVSLFPEWLLTSIFPVDLINCIGKQTLSF